MLTIFVLIFAPSIAIALAIYLTDRKDREPIRLLALVFLAGAISAIPTLIAEKILQNFNMFTGTVGLIYTSFFVAGLVEEFFKRKAVMYTAFYNPNFDEKLDGIVYAVFAALGFATVENFMYLTMDFTNNYYVAIMRGVFSVPGHALFGVTMGYYLSLAHFSQTKNLHNYYMIQSLLIPITLHGAFDFILMINSKMGMVIFVLYVAFLWALSLKRLSKYKIDSNNRVLNPGKIS